jgi:cytochrome c6
MIHSLFQRKGNNAMNTLFRVSVLFACASASVYACAQQPAEVYKIKCAPCHGATGAADTPAGKAFKVPAFSSDGVLKESDAALLAVAKSGKGKMPAWQDKLSDDQLKNLVAYIHSLQKKP